jgi:hypothetical protein
MKLHELANAWILSLNPFQLRRVFKDTFQVLPQPITPYQLCYLYIKYTHDTKIVKL